MNKIPNVKGHYRDFGKFRNRKQAMDIPLSEVNAMSYRITYVPTESDIEQRRGRGIRLLMLSGSFLLVLGMITVKYWPDGKEVLLRLMNSGMIFAGTEYLDNLARQISVGVPVGEAVTAFCRELIVAGLGQ